jgi:hypothetical protein
MSTLDPTFELTCSRSVHCKYCEPVVLHITVDAVAVQLPVCASKQGRGRTTDIES